MEEWEYRNLRIHLQTQMELIDLNLPIKDFISPTAPAHFYFEKRYIIPLPMSLQTSEKHIECTEHCNVTKSRLIRTMTAMQILSRHEHELIDYPALILTFKTYLVKFEDDLLKASILETHHVWPSIISELLLWLDRVKFSSALATNKRKY